LEEVLDAAGEVAFEAVECFAAGFPFGLFAGEVVGGVGVVEALGEREAVEGAVDLAVAAAVWAVLDCACGGGRDRCCSGDSCECRVRLEGVDAGDLADEFGGDEDAAAAFGEQLARLG
jgi:hypothetical protein